MSFDSVLKTVAPWLGAAMGGPPALVAMAVSTIGETLGLTDKTMEGVKTALSGATAEDMLKLKAAEQDFQVKMQELGFSHLETMEKVGAEDRADARKREIAVGDHTPRNLAYAVTVGFFAVLLVMVFVDIDEKVMTILNIMVGSLGTAWAGVLAYYFGKDSGSARTKELLAGAPPASNVKS